MLAISKMQLGSYKGRVVVGYVISFDGYIAIYMHAYIHGPEENEIIKSFKESSRKK